MRKKKTPTKLKLLPIAIAAMSVVIVMLIILLIEILKQNYIVYENVSTSTEPSNSELKNAEIIIQNNILLGGVINGKWISAQNIYNVNKGQIDIDMYSETAKYGTYKTAAFSKNIDTNIIYTTTTRVPNPDKFLALSSSEKVKTPSLYKADVVELDTDNVKAAMGKYRFLNNSVKIVAAYDIYIEQNEPGRLIVATSDSSLFGVYSVVVYVGTKGPQIVKYSYVKNSESSTSWPIYTVNFVIDIDGDKISEIVMQETTETTTSYVVMKYEKNIFKEVLKQTITL